MKRRTRTTLALVSSVAVLAACSTEDPNASGGGGGGGDAGDVETGNGVSDDTITVGILTDLSGPFAATGTFQADVMQAYWDEVNANDGVCGRDVDVDLQDHGYDPQKAVTLYRSMAPNVVAFQQILGSPVTAAILPLAEQEDLFVGGVGWASVALDFPIVQMPGTTYSVDAANAVDHLVEDLGLAEGDSVGVVYFVGDYGSDSLAGAEYAAEQHGLEVVPQEITPRDTDLSAQASALQQADVEAVILAAAPAQVASLAGVLGSQGVDVPIMGHAPEWTATLLDSPAGPALLENFYLISSAAPYGADEPGAQEAVEAYKAADPDAAESWEVPLAWGEALLLHTALENACDAGDLTPAGVVAGMQEIEDLDTDGLFAGSLSYNEPGQPPTRTVYLSRPDADAPGGMRLETTLEGPSAQSYPFG